MAAVINTGASRSQPQVSYKFLAQCIVLHMACRGRSEERQGEMVVLSLAIYAAHRPIRCMHGRQELLAWVGNLLCSGVQENTHFFPSLTALYSHCLYPTSTGTGSPGT